MVVGVIVIGVVVGVGIFVVLGGMGLVFIGMVIGIGMVSIVVVGVVVGLVGYGLYKMFGGE